MTVGVEAPDVGLWGGSAVLAQKMGTMSYASSKESPDVQGHG